MTTIEIKKRVNNLFKENKLVEAFNELENLDVDDFIIYGLKKKFFSKKGFWDTYLLNSSYFDTIFNSQKSIELLYHYFDYPKVANLKFEQKLLDTYPYLYVKMVRLSQVYIKKNRIKDIETLNFPSDYIVYKKAFIQIQKHESKLWERVEEEFQNIIDLPIEQILIHTIFWLENKRFRNQRPELIEYLGNIYSIFMRLIIKTKRDLKITEDSFYTAYENEIKQEAPNKENPLQKVLSNIAEWEQYNSNILAPFSFDMNMILSVKGEEIQFSYKDKEQTDKWIDDGKRIQLNNIRYIKEGVQFAQVMIEDNIVEIPGKSSELIELNTESFCKQMSSNLFIKDLGIDELAKVNDVTIKVNEMLAALITYSSNKTNRYENNILNFSNQTNNWFQSLVMLYQKAYDKEVRQMVFDPEPFLLMTEFNYIQTNQNAIPEFKSEVFEYQLNMFTYNNEVKIFNRFRDNGYKVSFQPFLKFGEVIFCPMIFFANNDWFYSFSNQAINNIRDNGLDNNSVDNMECELEKLIKYQGFESKLISKRETDMVGSGDIDVFAWDNNNTILIQLKRSFFRETLKGNYFEKINSESKAIKQLLNGFKFIQNPKNGIFELKNKPNLWFVSTSFEEINNEIDGCRKINYFELLWALRNKSFNSLKELIDYMENDMVLIESKKEFGVN